MDSRPMEDQTIEYCVETIEENEILFLLQDLHRKIDNVEKKFDQRMLVVEKGVESIIGAFEGYYQENVNFRNELKNAFRLTARKIFEADTADFELVLPCTSPKGVAILEKRIRTDPKAHSELRRRLFDLNGKDWQAYVRRAMELVWTTQTAENFSWSGQRMNIAVKNYKIILMVKDVAKVKYKIPSNLMSEVDRVMKRWFFYAGSRFRISKDMDINDPNLIMTKKQLRDEITFYVDPKSMSNKNSGVSDEEKINYPNDTMEGDPDYIDDECDDEIYEIEELEDHHGEIEDAKQIINFVADEDPIKFTKPVVLLENIKQPLTSSVELQPAEVKPLPPNLSPANLIKNKEDVHRLKSFRLPSSVNDLLPIKTNEDIQKAEILLKVDKYRFEMLEVLKKMKRECKETNTNFSKIYSDIFLKGYSWNGKNDHKSLENLKLSKLLIEAWKEPNQSSADFEKTLRVCVFQSHTRAARTQQNPQSLPPVKKLRMS